MGYEYQEGIDPTVVVNGFDGLSKVNLASDGLVAKGSTKGAMGANLNADDAIGTQSKTSLSVFDSQGNAVLVNFLYTKTAANEWSLDVQYNGSSVMNQPAMPSENAVVSGNLDPAAAVGDTFTNHSNVYDNTGVLRTLDTVYTMTPAGWEFTISHAGTPLYSDQLHTNEFDGAGDYLDPEPEESPELTLGPDITVGPIMTTQVGLTSKPGPSTISLTFDGSPAAVGTSVKVSFDEKGQLINPQSVTTGSLLLGGSVLGSLNIDITKTTQLGYKFNPDGGKIDGNGPNKVAGYQIDKEGVVYLKYENGDLDPRYRVALASVQSPDNLVPQSGNVYSQGVDSGVIVTGFAGSGDFGSFQSGALEGSNVDIANELTAMIESQRSYTANSKVFQTGADLLDVLVNLKR
jgi:flagellar hook protein FlgE